MRGSLVQLFTKRRWRHGFFWVCWVLGFTFIKSFGQASEIYFGWFSYYLVTLPIFVVHTYLVVYLLIPRFLNKKHWPIFVALFMLFFYGFSVIELILSNEFIFVWYPTGSMVTENYLVPGNVIRSGLGNLYIVLVFLASKTVRSWYMADKQQKELMQVELMQQMEDTISRVQPMMLLFAIDKIDDMVKASSSDVTRAIAHTSELLSELMMYHEENNQWFSREIELVKKLVNLVGLLKNTKPEVEFFISGDPVKIDLPPMILFSLVDLIFRKFENEEIMPELNIEASGFSNMITIQMLSSGGRDQNESMDECMQTLVQFEKLYGGKVLISHTKHTYGCSLIIRRSSVQKMNDTYTETNAFDVEKPAAG
ncbi:MAG: hypothetical protein DRQ40_07095 [Gammaproteobacteria bacterium]|nr:MAG: hypothetical protein DRQ40_07095 [Gammaproteobacteria bacterium]